MPTHPTSRRGRELKSGEKFHHYIFLVIKCEQYFITRLGETAGVPCSALSGARCVDTSLRAQVLQLLEVTVAPRATAWPDPLLLPGPVPCLRRVASAVLSPRGPQLC